MIHVILGPPAAGKSTHVREHARPGDIRVDFDDIANLITGMDPANHTHDKYVATVVRAARRTLITRLLEAPPDDRDVWIIHSTPSPTQLAEYEKAGAELITIDPGKDVVMKRIKRERPATMQAVAGKWYDTRTPKRSTTEKGLGWRHQQQRDRLLRAHKDGTPCWWCGLPMYRDKRRNPDGRALAADHTKARATHGTRHLADRLLHGTCNSQRQAGDHDDQRPALKTPTTTSASFKW